MVFIPAGLYKTSTSCSLFDKFTVYECWSFVWKTRNSSQRWDSERELFTMTPYTYYEIQKK